MPGRLLVDNRGVAGRRIAFVYHRIAPETLGGAERFYAGLSRQYATEGDSPVLVSMQHWPGPRHETREGVLRVGVAAPGRGRVLPMVRWALALFFHLLRHEYDVVHVCCFPHLSVVAARLALRRRPLVVDWHEVLPRTTWTRRLGPLGLLGWLAQRLAIRATPVAVTYSALHAERLRAEGFRGRVEVVPEFLPDGVLPGDATRDPRRVLFAGRLVDEKHPEVVAPTVAALRRDDPAWHAVVLGSGPVPVAGEGVEVRGYVTDTALAAELRSAAVLLHPSEREGFGLAVLEALAYGLPVVVVAAPDNAAVELVTPDIGVVCPDARPETLAAAIASVTTPETYAAVARWWAAHRETYSVEACAARLTALHGTR